MAHHKFKVGQLIHSRRPGRGWQHRAGSMKSCGCFRLIAMATANPSIASNPSLRRSSAWPGKASFRSALFRDLPRRCGLPELRRLLRLLEGVAALQYGGRRRSRSHSGRVRRSPARGIRCEGDRCSALVGEVGARVPHAGFIVSAQTCVAPASPATMPAGWRGIASGCSRSCDRGRSDRTPLWFDPHNETALHPCNPYLPTGSRALYLHSSVQHRLFERCARVAWRCGPGRCCHSP